MEINLLWWNSLSRKGMRQAHPSMLFKMYNMTRFYFWICFSAVYTLASVQTFAGKGVSVKQMLDLCEMPQSLFLSSQL